MPLNVGFGMWYLDDTEDSSIFISEHLALSPPSEPSLWGHADIGLQAQTEQGDSWSCLQMIFCKSGCVWKHHQAHHIVVKALKYSSPFAALCCVVHQRDITASGLWYLGTDILTVLKSHKQKINYKPYE